MKYIHQLKNWTDFTWDHESISRLLIQVRHLQGKLTGSLEALGFELREEAVLKTLTADVIKSTEIEGEILNPEQVRSSVARRLGMDISGMIRSDRHVEGVVEMMLDATQLYSRPLTKKRLFSWHAALFPTGRNGMHKILVGKWRRDSTGPMQVVSGPMGREKVHYEAPSSKNVEKETTLFLKWFNEETDLDPVLKSGIAHFWFVTLHPFEDGNGRIARALSDMQLARADGSTRRFYSMSSQIRLEREKYYRMLEKTQKGDSDITEWLSWYLNCLHESLKATGTILASVLAKSNFWETNRHTHFNDRQIKIINRLLDGFDGKLNTSKWAKINKCSVDTALRDIQELVNKKVLNKDEAGGRSTNYFLNQ